jgi:hypothetical protein
MICDLLPTGPPVSLAEALTQAVRTEGVDADVADRDRDQAPESWHGHQRRPAG